MFRKVELNLHLERERHWILDLENLEQTAMAKDRSGVDGLLTSNSSGYHRDDTF